MKRQAIQTAAQAAGVDTSPNDLPGLIKRVKAGVSAETTPLHTALLRSKHIHKAKECHSLGGGVRCTRWEVGMFGRVVERGESLCPTSAAFQQEEAIKRVASLANVHLTQVRQRRLKNRTNYSTHEAPWETCVVEMIGLKTTAGQRAVNAHWRKMGYEVRVRIVLIDPCPIHHGPREFCAASHKEEA